MKIATLDLAPELFLEFCKGSTNGDGLPRRFIVKENPLPDDVEIIRVGLADPFHTTLRLYLKSESFSDIPDGEPYPEAPRILYESVYDGEQ